MKEASFLVIGVRKLLSNRTSAPLLGALVFLLGGCAAPATRDESEAADAFVGPPTSRPVEQAAELFERLVKDIERAIAAKEYRSALGAIRAALVTEVTSIQARRLELLADRARKLYFSEQLFDSFVTADRSWVIVGEEIRGEIVVTNLSTSTVTIHVQDAAPATDGAPETAPGRPSVLRVVGDFREYWPDGSTFVSTEYHNVALDQDIVLAGGETVRIPFGIDSAEVSATSKFLREFDVEAEFFCGRVDVDGEVYSGALKSKRTRVRVFPRNAEHLNKDPVGRLREAFAKNAPLHLTLAAGFVEKKDRVAAMRTLLELLDQSAEGSVLEHAVMCGMHIISGEERGTDRAQWKSFAASYRP